MDGAAILTQWSTQAGREGQGLQLEPINGRGVCCPMHAGIVSMYCVCTMCMHVCLCVYNMCVVQVDGGPVVVSSLFTTHHEPTHNDTPIRSILCKHTTQTVHVAPRGSKPRRRGPE